MQIRMLRGAMGASDETGAHSRAYPEGAVLTVGRDVPPRVADAFLSMGVAVPPETPKAEQGPSENKMLPGPDQDKGAKKPGRPPGRPRKE